MRIWKTMHSAAQKRRNSMAYQKINEEITLYYEEYGDPAGKPLLSCQEQFGGEENFIQYLTEAGFHVYAIQIRGFGNSTIIDADYGEEWWNIWADDAVAFADALGIGRFYYTGSSHGSGIGWHICYRHPERVIAFFGIVCGPHERGGLETSQARWETIQAAQTQESWYAFVDKRFPQGRPELNGNETEEEKAVILKRQKGYDSFRNRNIISSRINPRKPFNWCKTEEELSALMSTIRIPSLLMGGIRDDIATPKTMLRSCTAVPDSKLILYESSTHGLVSEKPKEIVMDIVSFCQQRGL